MRVGVIGNGSIGQRHARDARALGHEVLCFDTDRSRSDVPLPIDLWEWEPHVAIICTPPDTHVAWACEAARRNCQGIFIEKPLSLDAVNLDKLCWLSRLAVTHVACPLRYEAGLRLMHETPSHIDGLDITAGYHLPTVRPDYRAGYYGATGVLLEIGSHALDLAQWFLGPCRITDGLLERDDDLGLPCETYADLGVKHDGGGYTTAELDWSSPAHVWRVLLYGDGWERQWIMGKDIDAAYRDELAAFLDATAKGQPAANPLQEALITFRTLLEAKQWAVQ